MSTYRAGHDPRCERSATKASRCRCQCQGRLHGVEATQLDLEWRDEVSDSNPEGRSLGPPPTDEAAAWLGMRP